MEFAYIWYLLNNLYYAEILFWRPAAVGRWLCLKVHQLAHRGVLRRACLARRLRAGSAGNSFPVAKTIEDVQLQNSTRTFLSCTNLRIWIYWLQRILEYDLCMALDFILEYFSGSSRPSGSGSGSPPVPSWEPVAWTSIAWMCKNWSAALIWSDCSLLFSSSSSGASTGYSSWICVQRLVSSPVKRSQLK